jgi:hypothetical protein
MKKVKDLNTGVIKYIPDESDNSLLKLSSELKRVSKKVRELEDRISKLEGSDA